MKKEIKNKRVCFYDDNDNEIMHIDFKTDDCIWFFESDKKLTITKDMELHSLLSDFMAQEYSFQDSLLRSSKNDSSLIWYSDCYYNPEDEWSVDSVSCLHIEKVGENFDIWCTKELDKKFTRPNKTYGVCFSPCGNGIYTRNNKTGMTLQTEFVTMIYQPLMFRPKQFTKK